MLKKKEYGSDRKDLRVKLIKIWISGSIYKNKSVTK